MKANHSILAIDPGDKQSGIVELLGLFVCESAKVDNEAILSTLDARLYDHVVIERVVLRGKAGNTLRDTIEWVGRFQEAATRNQMPVTLLTRSKVLGFWGAGNDSEIIKAMKKSGYTGLRRDEWQALALGLCFWKQQLQEVAA